MWTCSWATAKATWPTMENQLASFTLVSDKFGAIDADYAQTSSGRAVPRYVNIDGEAFLALGTADSGVFQLDSLSFTQTAPSSVDFTLGTGTTATSSLLETPWGSSKRTGRHQYLIRADELAGIGTRRQPNHPLWPECNVPLSTLLEPRDSALKLDIPPSTV